MAELKKRRIDGAVTIRTSFDNITTYVSELLDMDQTEMAEIACVHNQLCGQILVNDCYEKINKMNVITKAPTMEFFRHIRNACSHNGIFTITKPLSLPATWRGFEVTMSLNGTEVFDYIAIGDILHLLSDIEIELKNAT